VAPDAWQSLTRRKLAELAGQIQQATVARVTLEHALRCRYEDLRDCPTFGGILAPASRANSSRKPTLADPSPLSEETVPKWGLRGCWQLLVGDLLVLSPVPLVGGTS
jgi:hypothetical protein